MTIKKVCSIIQKVGVKDFTLQLFGGNMAKDFNVSILLDFYGELLSDKQKDILDLYVNEDLSLAEISENLDITRQGVRDAVKRAEQQLFYMEDKLMLVKKYNENEVRINDIAKTALAVKNLTNNKEICDSIDNIVKQLDYIRD